MLLNFTPAHSWTVLLALGCWAAPLHAQTEAESAPVSYVAPKVIEMLVGVRIVGGDGNMIETSAQTVFPTEWPEQRVELVETNVPGNINYAFRDLPGNNRQLLLFAPLITPGQTVEATVKVRIEKSHIVGPPETASLSLPRRPSTSLRQYLSASPYIDPNNSEIRKVVKQIDAAQPVTDWQRVEMLYDWVRDNISYVNSDLKTIQQALRDRAGDCEEMTSIFVALCRAARVPARCVWIPGHCYPEFYLEDESGQGYWFPCQVAGTRNFGHMPEYLPILQKGDRFKVPERTETLRYLSDYLTSKKVLGRRDPQVEFIRQLLGDAALLPVPVGGELDNPPRESDPSDQNLTP